MNDDMSTKDALFALDTTIEEDMKEYGREVTLLAIKHINSTPELYKFVKGNQKYNMATRDSATTWAYNHNNEFGDLFVTELDLVDWTEVERRV